MKQNRPGIHGPYRYETPSARELYIAYINSNLEFLEATMPKNVFTALYTIIHGAIFSDSKELDTLCVLCAFIKEYRNQCFKGPDLSGIEIKYEKEN